MQIKIEKPTDQYLQDRNVMWRKSSKDKVSRVERHYDSTEECYLRKDMGRRSIEIAKDGFVRVYPSRNAERSG